MLISLTRRAFGAAVIACAAFGANAQDFQPENPECIAPASPGGGWDFTCRQVAKTLREQDRIPTNMQVQNMAGGGGGVAFANVVNKRNDDDDLIVAASSATATRLAQGAFPGNTMDQVRWLATIGADYGVIAAAAESDMDTLPDLMEKIKQDPTSVSIGGGSAVGGWDHLKVLLAADAYGIDDVEQIKYVNFNSGGKAVTQLLAGSVQAFTGDISEAKGFVDSGDIKILAVLSDERLPGAFSKFPTAKEQGIDAIGANWRGFYAPGNMSDAAYDYWVDAISGMYDTDEWKKVMKNNGLAPLDLKGEEFEKFVANSVSNIEDLSKQIGIIQ